MTDTKILLTPVMTATFVALSEPAASSKKYTLVGLTDLVTPEAKAFKAAVGAGNKSVKNVTMDDGTAKLQINASTWFNKFVVTDTTGQEIEAPADILAGAGDVVTYQAMVSVKHYTNPKDNMPGISLQLEGVNIQSIDRSNRVELEAKTDTEADDSLRAKILAALPKVGGTAEFAG